MKYAYIDEYGAFGFKFEDPGCTTSMILTAVLVDDENVSTMETSAKDISQRYFGDGEMKSKSIGKNHQRRLEIKSQQLKQNFLIMLILSKT